MKPLYGNPSKPESAHDILRGDANPLDPFFSPRNIAVIAPLRRRARLAGRRFGISSAPRSAARYSP